MSYHLEKFNTLVIDTELDNRIKIKQITCSVSVFGSFAQAASLNEGMNKLNGDERIDTIFISEVHEDEELKNFIEAAKKTKWGDEATFILVIKDKEKLKTHMARCMMAGIDGFLCQPYSVESLTEIATLASRLRKERSEAKEVITIKFLMHQISEQISLIAQMKANNLPTAREGRKLVELCDIFKSLDDSKKQKYLMVAIDVFEAAPLPRPLAVKSYVGVSSRVKKRMEEKILKQLANNPH